MASEWQTRHAITCHQRRVLALLADHENSGPYNVTMIALK